MFGGLWHFVLCPIYHNRKAILRVLSDLAQQKAVLCVLDDLAQQKGNSS